MGTLLIVNAYIMMGAWWPRGHHIREHRIYHRNMDIVKYHVIFGNSGTHHMQLKRFMKVPNIRENHVTARPPPKSRREERTISQP